ncbi:MAG: hypothetical protein FD159_231 [Syntrophaceae bacterium]|nr:MAG: hypothetical protein FD159_231 [Syntrophaceae bacterium]
MKKNAYMIFVLLLAVMLILPVFALAEPKTGRGGEVKKGIQAEAACAIVGMSAEQSQLTALQRARAAAIEQAAGVSVTAATLVTNYTVAADFIKTYSRGFIVAEKVTWLPLGQYQKDPSTAPIPEYRVKIVADVYIPKRKSKAIGLTANLNNVIFRNGEKARVTIKTKSAARIALFNIMADDTVALLFPNTYEKDNKLAAGENFVFPAKDAKVELEMQTLADHKKDAEAIFVVAWDETRGINILQHFAPGEAIPMSEFFAKLSEIIDQCEDTILPYEVVAQ